MNDRDIVNYFVLNAIGTMNKTCFFFFIFDLGRVIIEALLIKRERGGGEENNVCLLSYLYTYKSNK